MPPSILKSFADNQALFDEVKRVVVAEFTIDAVPTDGISNQLLGEIVRARLDGLRKVEEAFKRIAYHRTPTARPEKQNDMR